MSDDDSDASDANLNTQPESKQSISSRTMQLRQHAINVAHKVRAKQKRNLKDKKIATYNSDSSISTDDEVKLDFKKLLAQIPGNISYVDKEFCPIGKHGVKHMLISNSGDNNQVPCCFCKVVTDTRIRVNQGCTGCKKAFHTNYFTAFHCPGEMGPQG